MTVGQARLCGVTDTIRLWRTRWRNLTNPLCSQFFESVPVKPVSEPK